jgi:hypothetical protein
MDLACLGKGFDQPFKSTIRGDKNQPIDFKPFKCELNGRISALNCILAH